MHQIGSLICNEHDQLMVKMTNLFLLCRNISKSLTGKHYTTDARKYRKRHINLYTISHHSLTCLCNGFHSNHLLEYLNCMCSLHTSKIKLHSLKFRVNILLQVVNFCFSSKLSFQHEYETGSFFATNDASYLAALQKYRL